MLYLGVVDLMHDRGSDARGAQDQEEEPNFHIRNDLYRVPYGRSNVQRVRCFDNTSIVDK